MCLGLWLWLACQCLAAPALHAQSAAPALHIAPASPTLIEAPAPNRPLAQAAARALSATAQPPNPTLQSPDPALPPQAAATAQPPVITLDDALRRAQRNEPAFAGSIAASRVAQLDRGISRNALLPSVVFHNTYQYTEPNGGHTNTFGGTQPLPVFIANDTVHEYFSQALVNETVSLRGVADIQLANANAARTAAEAETARRGLLASVVSLFYSELAATGKLAVAHRALNESSAFTKLTREREQVGESAHADVVRAELQQQGRTRDLADATLAADRARLELGILLFADPRTPYTLETTAARPLPTRAEIDAAASANDPVVKAAIATLRAGDAQVLRARAAYLPDLGLNLTYGINSPQFAARGYIIPPEAGIPENGTHHFQNLGYSAAVTVDIPVWDWFSTEKRVKQSEIQRQVAQVELTAAQKRRIVALDEYYAEAVTAQGQVTSLQQSVQTAQENLRLSKLRYSAGEATVLEVTDAQAALALAENAGADGEVRFRAALASLQTLTGAF